MPHSAAYALVIAGPLGLLLAGMLRHIGLGWAVAAGVTACTLTLFCVSTGALRRGSAAHIRGLWRIAALVNLTAALLLWALVATRLP
ncbi:MAG: hypothetical protein KDF24_06445 [Rhodocyclaceae bacterium]|nr:hypothetical protein [Rhodocyclaceae bacterium]MCB1962791.1 hypothetical protein [Rhodocyclaceae bacterium]